MKLSPLAALALCVFTAGCWESEGSLYGGIKPAEPFHAGKLAAHSSDAPRKITHFVLTQEADGAYRLTDGHDNVLVRFFAVPGLPRNTFLFESVPDDECRPGDACHPMTAQSERDYGLVRMTWAGAEVMIPDCDKSIAKLPDVKPAVYNVSCDFSSRASLETAARAQARRRWKPEQSYRYE